MAEGDRWNSTKYPNGCIICGQTRTRNVGRGMCSKHYKQWERGTLTNPPTFDDEVALETAETTTPSGPGLAETEERRPGADSPPQHGISAADAPPSGPSLLGGLFGGKKKAEKSPLPPTRERRPGVAPKRTSAAPSFEDAWAALGAALGRSPRHAPLGRYLAWQAGGAGEILDKAVSGTLIDRKLVQPAVRARASLEGVATLVGPPAIILAIESNPSRAGALLPVLRSAIRSSLPTMIEAMKRQKAREEKVAKAVKEMFPELPEGVDPVEEIIAAMFEGWIATAPAPAESPEAESAIA